MSLDTTSKRIIAVSIIVIISCFLPWWWFVLEYSGSSDHSYIIFISNPFFDSLTKFLYLGPGTSSLEIGVAITLLGDFIAEHSASVALLIAVIITLIGGIGGVISLGNKKVALAAAVLVLVGVLLYIIFLAIGQLPGNIDPNYFSDNGLNPIFGTYDPSGDETNIFGIFLGPIIAGLAGLALLILGLKSTKNRY